MMLPTLFRAAADEANPREMLTAIMEALDLHARYVTVHACLVVCITVSSAQWQHRCLCPCCKCEYVCMNWHASHEVCVLKTHP